MIKKKVMILKINKGLDWWNGKRCSVYYWRDYYDFRGNLFCDN